MSEFSNPLQFELESLQGTDAAKSGYVLRIDSIAKHFGGQQVLEGVTATLRPGEVVLIRGDNGSGKTTLLNILSGNLEADSGLFELRINGFVERFAFPLSYWRQAFSPRRFVADRLARLGVGRTWQEMRLFATGTILDNLSVAAPSQPGEAPFRTLLQWRQARAAEERNRAASIKLLSQIGLSGREDSSVDRISLGQAKRVAILRAIRAGAKVLLLDEPLAGLDRGGAETVLNLLKELVSTHEVTLVIVEHVLNIPLVLNLATTVWTLQGGKIEVCPATAITLDHNGIAGGTGVLSNLLEGCTARQVIDLGRDARLMVHEFEETGRGTILEVQDLVVKRGRRIVIGEQLDGGGTRGISFCLRQGELAILEAPNGWGKTTLVEALSGLLPRDSGTIRFHGTSAEKRVGPRSTISLLQARNNVFANLTVQEHFKLAGQEAEAPNLSRFLHTRAGNLSGGEKQAVAFEVALGAARARLLILDEPFSALDEKSMGAFSRRIRAELTRAAVLIAVPSGLDTGGGFER